MMLGAALGILMAGLGLNALGVRLKDRWAHSGGLILVLVGYFTVFTLLLWESDGSRPALGTALVLGAAAVFQLMTTFESGPPGAS
jgi:hypothetical protein